MAYPTIDELMASVGCKRWPERWREIYDGVMQDFDKNGGTKLTDPDFYRDIHARYGTLPQFLDVICEAAEAIAKREELARLLALLGAANADRVHAADDVAGYSTPVSPAGKPDLAVDMLTALATISMTPYTHDMLAARSFSEDQIRHSLLALEGGINDYKVRHDGAPGYHLMGWNQLKIDGKLFYVGRLEIELTTFRTESIIFENKEGDTVALANGETYHRDGAVLGSFGYEDAAGSFTPSVTETDDAYIGHPYDAIGYCSQDAVTLPKNEWQVRVTYGDPVISLHIPKAGGAFTPEVLDETFAEIRAFMKRHFPDFDYRALVCGSWLLDPQLEELLGAESNIVKFGQRFSLITKKTDGKYTLYFAFGRALDGPIDYATLPEDTRLQRVLKSHYMSGKIIEEPYGYIV